MSKVIVKAQRPITLWGFRIPFLYTTHDLELEDDITPPWREGLGPQAPSLGEKGSGF